MSQEKIFFETEANLADERRVAADLSGRWRCAFQKQEMENCIDFLMYRGDEVVACAEFKHRNKFKDQYVTVIMSKRKWDSGMAWSEKYDVPFIFVVEYIDGLFYVVCNGCTHFFREGGAPKEGDPNGVEICAHIQTSQLKRIR